MQQQIQSVIKNIEQIIVGKQHTIKLALTCLLAQGHLLIEDLPGVGKTTLANTISLSLGLEFKRIQFTNDLLPADIIGVSVFERGTSTFKFHKGPIFTNILLADEINRASPKTQSALLEAMEERQVSVDGVPLYLEEPFFVVATQNPQDQSGTFPLPESQLDRFLMCIELGYPDQKSELALLGGMDRRSMMRSIQPCLSLEELIQAQKEVLEIQTAPALIAYVQKLLQSSRTHSEFSEGLSPRCGLGLLRAARAWAWLDGRNYVIPDDIQLLLPTIAGHRLRRANSSQHTSHRMRAELIKLLLQSVDVT